jgi:hypothetical protein
MNWTRLGERARQTKLANRRSHLRQQFQGNFKKLDDMLDNPQKTTRYDAKFWKELPNLP